jgi:hypothetical protein
MQHRTALQGLFRRVGAALCRLRKGNRADAPEGSTPTGPAPAPDEYGLLDRRIITRSLWIANLEIQRPLHEVGKLASFDVAIPRLMTIKDCRLRRREGEAVRLTTGRLEDGRGFAVEMQKWLRLAILDAAVAAVSERAAVAPRDDAGDDDVAGLARFMSEPMV